MAAQSVTIKLTQNYRLRSEEVKRLAAIDTTPEKAQRGLSEQFIMLAVTKLYGDAMPRREMKLFRPIKAALDDESDTFTLDGTQAEFLFELFLGSKAEEKVQAPPQWAEWFGQWLDYLETERAALKAEA